MAGEDSMKKKIKKFAEGGYQGREGQKALNLDELPSLNVNTGTSNFENLARADLKSGTLRPETFFTAAGQMDNPFFKVLGQAYKKNPSLFNKMEFKKMKKGGKVKAKRKPIDGIAKSGKTRAKHRKDR